MFSGIIEEIGLINSIKEGKKSNKITISADKVFSDLKEGDSITLDGACMTVSMIRNKEFSVDISSETLNITTLCDLKKGNKVNMERAIRFSDRIGGHLVTGHVDGVGSILKRKEVGEAIGLTISAPPQILRYTIKKGSIAVDGVSLTINEAGNSSITVMLIPYTINMTTLGSKKIGEKVNLENDLIGKYVESLLKQENREPDKGMIDMEFIREHGFI
ncbi:MAG TPA: riboflavin synthase [Nitrospiria bacterium]|nr:riboflavin synthase [Nitrospiria bacterium]